MSTPHPAPASIKSWIWHNLAIGSKGVMFWQWRPELLGPESPGYGLCSPSGDSTERSAAAAEMAELIAAFDSLGESRPVAPTVGIVVSRKTPLLAFATERSMQLYADSLLGAYRAFLDNDVAIQFVHEDRLERDGVPSTIESLYWPMPSFASSGTARPIEEFVLRGGLLVSEAGPGAYVEHGAFAARVPSQGLGDVFGAEVVDSDISDEIEIRIGAGRILGAWGVDRLRPRAAAVVGHFPDGSPAVVENSVGLGRAVLIASYPSIAYETTRDVETGAWIAETTTGSPRPGVRKLLTRMHDAGDRSLLFVLNIGESPVQSAVLSAAPLELSAGLTYADGALQIDLPARGAALAVIPAA